jgi:hypothetical protein
MGSAVADTRDPTRDELAPEELERPGESDPRDVWLAHQLKNPLCAVKALVQLGLRNPAESASHGRLALLEREVDRVQEILTRHLAAARRRSDPGDHGPTLRPRRDPCDARPQPFES